MSILINHCYHWISYHLIETMLTEGYEVIGIHDFKSKQSEFLSMFLGRNDLFREATFQDQLCSIDLAIIFGEKSPPSKNHIKKKFRIHSKAKTPERNTTIIRPPLLFGKWMNMNETGMYANHDFISFDSKFFQEHAIYIEDFCKLLLSWVEQTILPSTVNIRSANVQQKEVELLENTIFIHDNIPIKNRLQEVLTHYKNFQQYYKLF